VAVTHRGGPAVDAAAIADAIALAGVAAITARTGSAGRFAVVCAVTGLVLAPAAGAVTALTAPAQSTADTGGAVLAAALCGAGLAVALAASLRAAGPAGALAGLVLLLAGLMAGYLAAGAVQLRALTGATTVPAAHAALATAAGRWTLTAAALAGAVALALACIGRRRTGARPSPGRKRGPRSSVRGGPGKVAGGAPVPGTGATLDHG
jgi:hypothetical protein